MSQPKRWSHGLMGMSRNKSGPWVTWDDYAALVAENERLRRAGDALQKGWINDIRQTAAGRMTIKTIEDCCPAIAAWNAAKEGRDAK